MRKVGEQGTRMGPGPEPSGDPENLEGLVELVTFHSEESGFCVLKVKARGLRDPVAVVGKLPRIDVADYRRPYVAVWLERPDNSVAANLAVWYDVKMRNVQRFIEEGDKVKVTLRFRGRELSHQQLGMNLLRRVQDDVAEIAKIEAFPRMEGRQMLMVLAPK